MIRVLIAGPERTGKSHVLLCLAKILSNARLRVLAVDTTKHCGMQNFFHLNPELECRESPDAPLGALDKSRAIHYGRYLHKENSVKAA